MSCVRDFYVRLSSQGFWNNCWRWAATWGISALLMFLGLKEWAILTGLYVGFVALGILLVTARLWMLDRGLAKLKRQLEQISVENAMARRKQQLPPPEECRLPRCERCFGEYTKRADGKRSDPHYGGLCLACDGTGYIDPKKSKASK